MISNVNELTPERALIFRLTHADNLSWILDHGLHCKASDVLDPNFVEIGNEDLILKRPKRSVPVTPGGTLNHYIPFYFTPCSPMLYNIRTGWNNVTRRPPGELVLLVTSLRILAEHDVPFVFSDRHAFLHFAKFSSSLDELDSLAWDYWQRRDFQRDADNPQKVERYQAEALVYRHLPVERIAAIACSDELERVRIGEMVREHRGQIEVVCRRQWFFPRA